jgi:hypothetical protein
MQGLPEVTLQVCVGNRQGPLRELATSVSSYKSAGRLHLCNTF